MGHDRPLRGSREEGGPPGHNQWRQGPGEHEVPELELPEFLRQALASQDGLAPGRRFNARVLEQVREASAAARWATRFQRLWQSLLIPDQVTGRITVGLAGLLVLLVLGLAFSFLGVGREPVELKAQFPRTIPGAGLRTPLPLEPERRE